MIINIANKGEEEENVLRHQQQAAAAAVEATTNKIFEIYFIFAFSSFLRFCVSSIHSHLTNFVCQRMQQYRPLLLYEYKWKSRLETTAELLAQEPVQWKYFR